VSVDTSGTRTGDAASVKPRLTPDGRFVAFESDAGDLVAVDGNGMRDVFVRDLVGGTTVLVSHTLAGPGGGAATSYLGSISADGRFVGFDTTSADIVAGDGNGAADVFLADLQGNPTRLVSVNRLGTGPGNGASSSPVVSPDGRWVVFRSDASDLVPRDTNGTSDLFVRDMLTGTTRLVSSTTNGKDSGNAYSSEPVLAADGKTLVFSSDATNLVPGDHNFAGDVFVRSIR
jgi:Tol biopolymer transport system component